MIKFILDRLTTLLVTYYIKPVDAVFKKTGMTSWINNLHDQWRGVFVAAAVSALVNRKRLCTTII